MFFHYVSNKLGGYNVGPRRSFSSSLQWLVCAFAGGKATDLITDNKLRQAGQVAPEPCHIRG